MFGLFLFVFFVVLGGGGGGLTGKGERRKGVRESIKVYGNFCCTEGSPVRPNVVICWVTGIWTSRMLVHEPNGGAVAGEELQSTCCL